MDKHSAELNTRESQLKKLNELRSELQLKFDESLKVSADLTSKLEIARQGWAQEKAQLVAKKEEEFLVNMQRLEKRFEDDYSTFMKTHRDAIQKTLNEKSVENAREKERLIDMYEKRLAEHDASESHLKRRIKELDQRHLKLVEANVQTSPERRDGKSWFNHDLINPFVID
jgi:exonuclease VII large subunit